MFKELENDYEEYDFKEVDITGYENNEITADRLIAHECIIGESIHDDFEQFKSNVWEVFFVGYLMAKRKDLSKEILEVVNYQTYRKRQFISISELEYLFDNGDDEYPMREFFVHYAEFANLTEATRARFNKHMINISVGYGEEPNI